MHEFVVTLRKGQRYTVTADRVVLHDANFVALVADDGTTNSADPLAGTVALFTRGEVAAVVVSGHLVSEEKVEAISPQYVVGDSDIPF